MPLPFFYNESINVETKEVDLNEETSRHVAQVLRMKEGDAINLTNGKGYLFSTEILSSNKKKVAVKIIDKKYIDPPAKKVSIAISLLKNNTRFEWFLEKATEIGIINVIPLLCSRTERVNFRQDRMKNILVSAMLQSQQSWLPGLSDPQKFERFINTEYSGKKFIAHCSNGNKSSLLSFQVIDPLILIGPEGDFTNEEITAALNLNYVEISLGNTRLRTETAALVAVTLLNNS